MHYPIAIAATVAALLAAGPALATEDGADGDGGHEQVVEDAPVLVTLDEVLERAAAVSPLALIEEAQEELARTRLLEARWQRGPRIRFDSTVSPAPRVELEVDPNTGELDPFSNRETDAELLESIIGGAGLSFRNELSAVLPLTSFGKIRIARQLAEVGIDVEGIERDVAIAESQFEALRAYLTVQWYREVDRLLREAEGRLDDAAEQLEWDIDDGVPHARTSLRQLRIARTDFASLRADADEAGLLARHALVTSLALPIDFRAERLDESMPSGEVPELDAVLEYSRANRADFQLLESASRAADLQHLLRVRTWTPDVYFAARLNHAWTPTVDDVSGAFINDPYNRFGFGFLFGLRWNMNPGVTAARVRRAEAQSAIVEAQREAAWLGIELEVTEAYLEATGKRNVLISYDDALRAANAWLNQVQFQYDQGLADYEDLKDPLETYYRTAGGYYEALLRYRLAVANLAMKCGATDFLRWPGLE